MSQILEKELVMNGSVAEHLPGVCKALGSSSRIIKKKKRKDPNANATGGWELGVE